MSGAQIDFKVVSSLGDKYQNQMINLVNFWVKEMQGLGIQPETHNQVLSVALLNGFCHVNASICMMAGIAQEDVAISSAIRVYLMTRIGLKQDSLASKPVSFDEHKAMIADWRSKGIP